MRGQEGQAAALPPVMPGASEEPREQTEMLGLWRGQLLNLERRCSGFVGRTSKLTSHLVPTHHKTGEEKWKLLERLFFRTSWDLRSRFEIQALTQGHAQAHPGLHAGLIAQGHAPSIFLSHRCSVSTKLWNYSAPQSKKVLQGRGIFPLGFFLRELSLRCG